MVESSNTQESMAAEYRDRSEDFLRRIILVCIAITAGISVISIAGWTLNWLILASISNDYIPMPLSTALVFIVLSGALLVYLRQSASTHVRMLAKIGVLLVLLVTIILLVDFLSGWALDIERFWINSPGKFQNVPINHMSPITATNFILAELALLLLLNFPGQKHARGAAAILATLVVSVGMVVLIGYFHAEPLLYRGTIIPMALTTAIAFVFLGSGITAAAGQDNWPIRAFTGSSVRARLMRAFLPISIAIIVIGDGSEIYILPLVGTHIISESFTALFSVILVGIITSKLSHIIGDEIDSTKAQRKLAEDSLKQSEESLKLAQRISKFASWDWNIKDGTLSWSDEIYRQYDLEINEIIPSYEAWTTFVHPDDLDYANRSVKQMLEEDKPYSINIRMISKKGRLFFIRTEGTVYKDENGKVVRVIGTQHDITERKAAEEELNKYRVHLEELVKERTASLTSKTEQLIENHTALTVLVEELNSANAELILAKERAEAADRIKSVFLATMSHELRTPLNSIIGFTSIILEGFSGPLNDEQTKQLELVKSSGNHLLSLINDVLDISKIEAGQFKIEPSRFEMRNVINAVVNTVAPLAKKQGLSLHVEVAPMVGTIVNDHRRVEQILLNLLSNAIKFTEKGEVKVECTVSDGQVITHVIDTGIGIKPQNMENLYKPFLQLENGLSRRFEGTGLGLSISKKLVEAMGGRIWAESEFRKGSVFSFSLPLKREAR